MKTKTKISLITILLITMFFSRSMDESEASKALSLIINDKDVTSNAMPVIERGRTLVPIRFISEELGAKVTWFNEDKTILVEKNGNSVLLKIGSQLVSYNNGEDYELSDVAPKLLRKDKSASSKTYVPLRLIGNLLDIGVEWNEAERNVYIDSNKATNKEAISTIKIISQDKGSTINGQTILQVNTEKDYKEGSEIQFLLLEKGETGGFIIAKGKDIKGKHDFLPKIEDNGEKILVARVLDKNGVYLDGDAIPIKIQIKPKVSLAGVNQNSVIDTTADLSTKANFLPLYVKYEITKSNGDKKVLTDLQDPLGTFKWNPMMKDNGVYSIRAIAYDRMDKPYYSKPVKVEVKRERSLKLNGVTENMTIDKGVNLIADRNFDVSQTEYLIKDLETGIISTIAKLPYGGYTWKPGPKDSGEKELFVRVVDRGRSYESEPIRVVVDGQPKLFIKGIGPKEVINKDTALTLDSNVEVENIKYIITNTDTNKVDEIIPNKENKETIYSPIKTGKGNMTIKAQGKHKGKIISSDTIEFKVFHGDFHGPKPIIAKDKFLPMASKLAVDSYETTGMSASLQTAQAILETGWGQSIPVDKYTGALSNNMFGIKGQGPKGSVTLNTWEVYNGITYRVDADFRSYNSIDESWKDHKSFLLHGERYKPFTEVMFDYTQGAWAIKRAGYATDPEYPIKLINLINQHKLYELDKIDI